MFEDSEIRCYGSRRLLSATVPDPGTNVMEEQKHDTADMRVCSFVDTYLFCTNDVFFMVVFASCDSSRRVAITGVLVELVVDVQFELVHEHHQPRV